MQGAFRCGALKFEPVRQSVADITQPRMDNCLAGSASTTGQCRLLCNMSQIISPYVVYRAVGLKMVDFSVYGKEGDDRFQTELTLAMVKREKTSPMLRAARILVANSKPLFRSFLRGSLQQAGFIVYVTGDGQEALDLLRSGYIDLLLLDGSMQDFDAEGFCAEARKASNVPIILLSAMRRPDILLKGYLAGADDVITKPFELREVELRIQRLLQGGTYGYEDSRVIGRR